MSSELYRIGAGHGIKEIVEKSKEVHGLEPDENSEAIKQILRRWAWDREHGSKAAMLEQVLRNQLAILRLSREHSEEVQQVAAASLDATRSLLEANKE